MSNENLPENIDNIPTAEVEELIEAPTPTTENASAPSVPTEDKLATEEIPQPSPISTPPSNRENLDEEDTDNFLPTETHTWYYSLRDLVDEIFWGVIFMAVWIGLFFHYPTSPSGLMFYNILTVLFLVSIIYFSVLHNPLKIFLRNNDPKNPRPHRVGKETLAFALLLLGVAVFLYRLPANFAKQVTPPETATQEVMETAEITETIQTVPPTENTPVENTPVENTPAESVLTETAPATELELAPESELEPTEAPTIEAAKEVELEPVTEPTVEPITEPAESTAEPIVESVEALELPEPTQTPAENIPAENVPAENIPAENVPTENTPNEASTESQSTITTLIDDTEIITETEESKTAEKSAETADTTEAAETVKQASWSVADGIRYTLLATFGLFTWGYWINLAVRIFFNRICTSYELTPVMLIFKSGFFVTKVRHIAIWDIAQVNVSRNLWQRILYVGTVELRIRDHRLEDTDENSDVPDNIILLHGLENPQEVKDLINTYRLFIRRRMGRRFLNNITK